MRAYPYMPGVPAAGHVSGGFGHPGRIDGCPKCPDPPRHAERQRGRHVNTPEEVQAHVKASPGTTLAGAGASPALVQAALRAGLIGYTTETGRGISGNPVIVRRYYAGQA